jgi:hypothetical protein
LDWKNKISKQVFFVEKDSVIFGFSLGAILARLVIQKHECKLVIFSSMTPLRHFKGGEQEKLLVDVVGLSFVNDIKNNLLNENDFNLVIFDEAHRAVGEYAYVSISSFFLFTKITPDAGMLFNDILPAAKRSGYLK